MMAVTGEKPQNGWDLTGLARLVGAILLVQGFFWLAFNPIFVQPKVAPFEPFEITQFQSAALASPDAAGLEQAKFTDVVAGPGTLFRTGYYALRVNVDIPAVPVSGVAMLDQSGGDNNRIYVNGKLLYGYGEAVLPAVTYHGLFKEIIRIPPSMLQPGENRIDTVMVFDIPRLAGKPPPLLGDYQQFARAFGWKSFLLDQGRTISVAVGFALSLFIFVALVRSENKALLLWLFLLTLSWSLRGQFFLWYDMPIHGFVRGLYYALITLFLSACWPIVVDQWTEQPLRFFKPAIFAAFAIGASVIIYWLIFNQGDSAWDKATDLLDMLGLLFMAAMLVRLLWHFWRSPDDRYWEAALLVMLGSLVAIFLVNTLVWGRNTPYLTLTQPLFLFAFAAAFFARNFRLFQSSAQINAILQEKLDIREAELAAAHAREKEFVRLEAHGHERQRIMRDMHDGLGSHLMSMLMMAKRGKARHDDYAEGLQQVIDEMRLMIDSMDSVGESLKSALAIFRKRVMPRVTNAGFAFAWNMAEDCALPDFGPREVLQIFRILQEAVTNALKHSGGNQIDITIRPNCDPAWALQILVADNGQGLAESKGRGRGLGNMAVRAESIGAKLDVSSDKNGTLVTLDLPEKSTRSV